MEKKITNNKDKKEYGFIRVPIEFHTKARIEAANRGKGTALYEVLEVIKLKNHL